MKIIAGKFKGKNIKTSNNLPYRPTKSLLRKSIFDSVMPHKYLNILDLFAGSGAVGFEAASRGVESVTFVEKNYSVMQLLRYNAKIFSGPDYKFFRTDAFKFFNKGLSFDLIFADPPYGKIDLIDLSEIALMHLNDCGKYILECTTTQTPFLDSKFKDFGSTRILFWDKA